MGGFLILIFSFKIFTTFTEIMIFLDFYNAVTYAKEVKFRFKKILLDLENINLYNIATPVLLYGAPIWADVINTKEYRKTRPVEGCVKVCQCLSRCLYKGSLFAGWYTPIKLVADEYSRVYSVIHSSESEKNNYLKKK